MDELDELTAIKDELRTVAALLARVADELARQTSVAEALLDEVRAGNDLVARLGRAAEERP